MIFGHFFDILGILSAGIFFNLRPYQGDIAMKMTHRVLIALGVLALDLVVFFLPLTALFLAYVFIYNPPWFRELINSLDGGQEVKPQGGDQGTKNVDQRGDQASGMQQREELDPVQLHLRSVLEKGDMLRVHLLSSQDEGVAGMRFFGKG